MIILVAVTITLVSNGKLFGQAQNAADQTTQKAAEETAQALQTEYDLWALKTKNKGKTVDDFFNEKVSQYNTTYSNGIYTDNVGNQFKVTVDSGEVSITPNFTGGEPAEKETTYSYTGAVQIFNPTVSGKYKLEVWGAQRWE